jgi:hypothetical protein
MQYHYLNRLKYQIEPYTTTDLTTLISNNLYLTQLSHPALIENQAAINYSLQWIVQLPLLQQSLSNAYLFEHFIYTPGLTTIETTIDKILAHKKEFAKILRTYYYNYKNRWSSRYVSGYICPNKSGLRGQAAHGSKFIYPHKDGEALILQTIFG